MKTICECPKVSIALLHYPVRGRKEEIITTSVTSVDVHDIARIAATYRVSPYYIVTPVGAQIALVHRICNHWLKGFAVEKQHPRVEALSLVKVAANLEEVCQDLHKIYGIKPIVVVTGAKLDNGITEHSVAREAIRTGRWQLTLLVFGTGWGLSESIISSADVKLAPIRGKDKFNHLSVRAAVAIILDRLLGDWV